MAYAFGVGQTDKRNQTNQPPSEASGLTTGSPVSNTASNNQNLDKRVGTSQAPGVSNTASKAPGDFTKSNFGDTNAIIDRNQGADQSGITNKITSDAQNQANSQVEDINKKGQDYLGAQTTKFGQQYQAANPDDINGVASGNQTATSKLNNLLYGAVANPDDFDAGTYDPIKANEYLKNGDITSVLMNRGAQNYTSGMGALDNLMFGKSGGFQQVGNKVQDLQNNVQNAYGQATNKDTGFGAQATKARDTAVDTARTGTRNSLQAASDAVMKQGNEGLAAANAQYLPALEQQRGSQRQQAGSAIASKVTQLQQLAQDPVTAPFAKDALTKLYASLGVADGGQLPTDYSKNAVLDQFIKYNPANMGVDDFITSGNAQGFNNINSLLHTGQSVRGQTGPLNTGSSAFDPDDVSKYIQNIVSKPMEDATAAKAAQAEAARTEAARQEAARIAAEKSAQANRVQSASGRQSAASSMDAPSTGVPIGADADGKGGLLQKPLDATGDALAEFGSGFGNAAAGLGRGLRRSFGF